MFRGDVSRTLTGKLMKTGRNKNKCNYRKERTANTHLDVEQKYRYFNLGCKNMPDKYKRETNFVKFAFFFLFAHELMYIYI